MKKSIFISDIDENSSVCDCFFVKQKSLNKAKNNKSYLALKLCDKTGELEARVWDNAEYIATLFDGGDIIDIKKGAASLYQKRVQINIAELRRVEKSEVDMSDFIAASEFGLDDMLNELKGYCQSVKNKHLKKLLESFFDDKDFTDDFIYSSAAKALHHSYLGGLLEHTLSVTRLIMLLMKNYDGLNEDLLITGALLHDIGKVKELKRDIGFEYTDSGRLIGHIVIGTVMLDNKISGIKGFPPRLADLLKHMILSHHGIYEWGSPKKPKTLEALVLHYADDLDAKIAMFKAAVKRDIKGDAAGWTAYNPLFERYLYRDVDDYDESVTAQKDAKKDDGKKPAKPKDADTNQFSMFEEDS